MKKISQSATITGMGFLLVTFAASVFLLTTNQSLPSILGSVFYKPDAASKTSTIVWLATGSADGTYYLLGNAIAEAGRKQGINIEVCSTGGSYDNIALLQEGSVSLALAQVDALDDVMVHKKTAEISAGPKDDDKRCQRHSQSAQPARKPALVTYLYSEMVHLILRPHFYVGSLTDLKQDAQHVWLGHCGSGSRKTTERLLQASGIVEADIEQQFPDCKPSKAQSSMGQIKDWKMASDRLMAPGTDNDHLDAFFWTRAVQTIDQPSQGLKNCDKDAKSNPVGKERDPIYCLLDSEAHIAALPTELIDRMATDNLYVETAIPLDAYGGKRLKQGVPTVGLATVLIAPESYQDDKIRDLINMIQKNKSTIEHRTGVEFDLLDRQVPEHEHLADFVHAGARSHLKAPDLKIAWITAIGSLVGLLPLLIYHSPRWLTANPPAVSYAILLFAILLLVWCGFAYKLKEAEGRFNPNFQTTATSMRTMLFYVVGSIREHRPVTRQGESLIAWALFVIPLIFGWLTSDVIKEGVRKLSDLLAGAFSRAGAESAAKWFFSIGRALRRPRRGNLPAFQGPKDRS
jgi:TRAP-type uncharacterized transport system substrate-binding protein